MLASGSSSTPAAQLEVAPLPDSIEWVQLRERHAGKTYFWNRRTNSTVWQGPAGVEVVWYGERNEEGGSGTGTGTRVSPRLTSLLFFLGEERYRQPTAVHKYWAPCRLCRIEVFFTVNNGRWFCHPRGTLLVLEVISLVQLTPAFRVYVHFRAAWTTFYFLSVSLVVMVSQMS